MDDRRQFEWSVVLLAFIVVLWCFEEFRKISAESVELISQAPHVEANRSIVTKIKEGFFE